MSAAPISASHAARMAEMRKQLEELQRQLALVEGGTTPPPASGTPATVTPSGGTSEQPAQAASPQGRIIAPTQQPPVAGVSPTPDLGRSASAAEVLGLRAGLDARTELQLPERFTDVNVQNPFVSAALDFGNTLPFIEKLIPKSQEATLEHLTLKEIASNPESLKIWDGFSAFEKSAALMDGTDKLAELVGAPQEFFDRMFGSKSIQKFGDKAVEVTTRGLSDTRIGAPGAAPSAAAIAGVPPRNAAAAASIVPGQPGSELQQRGSVAVPAGANGSIIPTPAAAPVSAVGGGLATVNARGAPTGRNIPAGGVGITGVTDFGKLVGAVVTTDDDPNFPRGRVVFRTMDELRGGLDAGTIQLAVKDPNEFKQYADTFNDYAQTSLSGRQIQSLPEDQQGRYLLLGGETVTTVGPDGNKVIEHREVAAHRRARGVATSIKMVENADGTVEAITFDEAIDQPAGSFRSEVTRNIELSEPAIERAKRFKSQMPQFKKVIDLIDRMGDAGLTFSGDMGVVFGNMFAMVGEREIGDKITRMMGGGDLGTVELGALKSFILASLNQQKEALLNDKRLTDKDQKRIDRIGQIDQVFANKETILLVYTEFIRFGLITSELDLQAAREPQEFPVDTEDGYTQSALELGSFLNDYPRGIEWADDLRLYEELDPRLKIEAAGARVPNTLPAGRP